MPKNKQYTKEEKKFIKDIVDSAPKEAPHREVEALGNCNFGPYVAYFKCHDSLINGLRRKGDKLEQGSRNSKLAGILSDQRGYTKEDKEWFIKEFQPYITKYINDAINYIGQPFNSETHSSKFQLIDLWINYMKSGEHNPQHNHNGQLSWVIYLEVPDLTEEKNNFKGTGMGPGIIGFHYGENHRPKWAEHTYKYDPVASHMFIFPAQLRHEVLPFFTKDKTRISVSGNLYLIPPNQQSYVRPTDEELAETPKDQYKD
tara:strand:+ start:737 stop:1510 length:774 start_codon:yes stop_codon:yes gene_type:complete